MKNLSIKKKLLISFGLVILVPVTIICVIIGMKIRTSSVEGFIDSTSRELSQVDNAMGFFVNAAKMDVALLATHPLLAKTDTTLPNYRQTSAPTRIDPNEAGGISKDMHLMFKQMHDNRDAYIEVYMGSKWGGYLSSLVSEMPGGYNPLKRGWYSKNINTDGLIITPAYMTLSTKAAVFSVVSAVKTAGGDRVGVVGVDVALKALTDLVNEIKIGKTGYAMLVRETAPF